MHSGITSQLEGVVLNGDPEARYSGNVNLSFAFVEGESLLMGLKEVGCGSNPVATVFWQANLNTHDSLFSKFSLQIAVSSGSACTSASLEPSYVLRALGVEEVSGRSLEYGCLTVQAAANINAAEHVLYRNLLTHQ